MERLSLAVVDAPVLPPFGDRLRIEFNFDSAVDDSIPCWRSRNGQLRLGRWMQPVSVKWIDSTLGDEFGREFEALATAADAGGARLYDVANASTDIDPIPPAILCRHAAGALSPICPSCAADGVTSPLEPSAAFGSQLRCEICSESFSEPTEAILEATLQRDAFCNFCPNRKGNREVCHKSSEWLTFRPAHFLVVERGATKAPTVVDGVASLDDDEPETRDQEPASPPPLPIQQPVAKVALDPDVQQLLSNILLYAVQIEGMARIENQFLHTWNVVQQPRYREGRRWRRWIKGVRHLFQLYDGFQQSRRICFEWLNKLQSSVFFALEEGLKTTPTAPKVEVSLQQPDFEALGQYAISDSVKFFRESAGYLATLFEARTAHFRTCQDQWSEWTTTSPSNVFELRNRAEEHWKTIEKDWAEWRKSFLAQADRIANFLDRIDRELMSPWREAIPPLVMDESSDPDVPVPIVETRLELDRSWLPMWAAMNDTEKGPIPILKSIRLGPAFVVEVIFGLNWYEDLKRNGSRDSRE